MLSLQGQEVLPQDPVLLEQRLARLHLSPLGLLRFQLLVRPCELVPELLAAERARVQMSAVK